MNSNSMPPMPPTAPGVPQAQKPFTEEALKKKFSFSFTRGQIIMMLNIMSPVQLPVGDLRTKVVVEVIDELHRTAIQSLTDKDYEQPAKPKGAEEPLAPEGAPVTN